MPVWMTGVDHNRAALDVRGEFSFTKKKMKEAFDAFRSIPGLAGCVILSTCNRMEWWLSVEDTAQFSPKEKLCVFLDLCPEKYGAYLVERKQEEAVEHLFRLAAGLESRIVGEDQILTQVGEALQFARAAYATDHTLEVLFRLAVTAGKRVKTETSFSTADRSVIHAAIAMLAEQGIPVRGKTCMVIGNGMMGKLSAQALMEAGAHVTVTVRQYTSGLVDIPKGADRINYKERYGFLPGCDLVVSATNSPNYTITRAEMEPLRVDHPVCLVDLAVPRDIEPETGTLPGFLLYDIDAFHIDLQSAKLRENIAKAEMILKEEEERFYAWYRGQDLFPRINSLKKSAGEDVVLRLTPVYRNLPLQEDEKEELKREIETAAERMMNKLLFSMRASLSDRSFLESMDAMEGTFREENRRNGQRPEVEKWN